MRINYQQFDDDDDIITEIQPIFPPAPITVIHHRQKPLMKWPKVIGIVQIFNGFVTLILGACEVFLIPLLEDKASHIHLGKDNCFGAGLWAGTFMMFLGSTAIRVTISKRATTVLKFFNLIILNLVVYTGLVILLIVGYSLHWTTREQFSDHSFLYEAHVFITISTLLGLMFAITAFIQYYDDIFFGEIQLCRKWSEFFLSCLYRPRSENTPSPSSMNSTSINDPI